MKKLISSVPSLLALCLILLSSCCEIPGRVRYEWNSTIQNEERRAIIYASSRPCEEAPVIIHFHGRGGFDADSSAKYMGFHNLWKAAVVVYAEGTNFDNRVNGKKGWEIRFPHVYNACAKTKDLDYVQQLLNHLSSEHKVDEDNIFISGYSSGGFFTLALTDIMNGRFKAAAAAGAYTSFAPKLDEIDCSNTYKSGLKPADLVAIKPMPTFLMFGDKEATISSNNTAYKPDCDQFSLLQSSIYQLCKKNNSQTPDCSEEDFMTNFDFQSFEALNNNSAETRIRLYDGDHKAPEEAKQWIIDYFVEHYSK